MVCLQIAPDDRQPPAQFLPVASIAFVPKTAEPLETVGLADNRAGSYHLPALAPPVARGADVIQSAKGQGQFFCLGQGPLSSSLARPIDIKDHPGVSCS